MKLIVFVEKEVANTTEASELLKQLENIAVIADFQVRDDQIKQEIKDKVVK
jgi:hypothetical protein